MFGGFAGGSRINSLRACTFTAPNNLAWSLLKAGERPSKTFPIERNAHSAVAHSSSVFAFGGQDEDNNKLNDLWEFNLTTKQWSQVVYQDATAGADIARSGHVAVTFGAKMYIFGGIVEVMVDIVSFV